MPAKKPNKPFHQIKNNDFNVIQEIIDYSIQRIAQKKISELQNRIPTALILAKNLLITRMFHPTNPKNYNLQPNPKYSLKHQEFRLKKFGYTNQLINLQMTLKFKNSITINNNNNTLHITGRRNITINQILKKRKMNAKLSIHEKQLIANHLLNYKKSTIINNSYIKISIQFNHEDY